MDDPIITIGDARACGHCVKGIKEWFERHDLDFRDFMRNGIRASKVLATNDALGKRIVVETAKRRKERT